MAWTAIIESGDTVMTPHGAGKVEQVGGNGTSRVNVGGQLFEVPTSDITKTEVEGDFKVGDWVTVTGDEKQVRQLVYKRGNGEFTTRDVNTDDGTLSFQYGTTRAPHEMNKYSKQRKDIEGGKTPEGEPDKMPEPVSRYKIKEGDRVQRADNPDRKGTVTGVTQRSVEVKFDNDRTATYSKRGIEDELNKAQEGEPQPETTPEAQPKAEPTTEPTPATEADTAAKDAAQELYGLLNLKKKLEEKIENEVDAEMTAIRDLAKKNQKLEVKVGDKVNVIPGLKHMQLEQLITYAALRLSPLLVGMAGTGKTHAGEQTAVALGLDFYSMSVGAQTSKSDIIGYMAANGDYVKTHFRDAYEKGGVFLMDEIDAGNANVLIQINAALSNGICAFPDAMVKRHEDFVFVASANTFGNGANRQYVGRNQLDAATLDRFAVIEWKIDDELESNLTTGLNGKAWYMAVRAARDCVAEKSIRALISPRATQKGSRLLETGQDLSEVIHATMLASVPDDKRTDVEEVATTIFNKFASEVPGRLPKSINPEVSDLFKDKAPF